MLRGRGPERRSGGTGHAQCDAYGSRLPPARSSQTALGSTTHQAMLRNGSRIAGTNSIACAKDASPPTRSQLCRARPARQSEMERDQNKDVSSKTSDKIALWEFAQPGLSCCDYSLVSAAGKSISILIAQQRSRQAPNGYDNQACQPCFTRRRSTWRIHLGRSGSPP